MIRGIYSTALVKLALKNGIFEIVSPTESQKRRFGISDSSDIPDINIGDAKDRHSVKIIGDVEKIAEFVEAVRRVDDSVLTWWKNNVENKGALCILSFPMQAKGTMDMLRSEVTYTVPYHHYCRAGSEGLSLMVSLAENLVDSGVAEAGRVSEMFADEVKRLTPRIGSTVRIYHTKLSGRNIQLSPGKVIWRREGEVKILRRIIGNGVYDGLGIPKSIGDTAVMHVERGKPYTVTRYYSINNTLKGEYYNICTPVEVYDTYIRYVDLGVDVVKPADGEPRIIDIDELEQGLNNGVISRPQYEKALEIANEILNSLSKR